MESLKMSDFFVLPVSDDAIVNIDYGQTVHENNDGVAPFDAATHAINNHDRLVEENAELRKMLKRNKQAFLNQIELDLIRDSAKDETREIADSIHRLLNK